MQIWKRYTLYDSMYMVFRKKQNCGDNIKDLLLPWVGQKEAEPSEFLRQWNYCVYNNTVMVIHVPIHVSKPIERIIPRMSPNVNCRFRWQTHADTATTNVPPLCGASLVGEVFPVSGQKGSQAIHTTKEIWETCDPVWSTCIGQALFGLAYIHYEA